MTKTVSQTVTVSPQSAAPAKADDVGKPRAAPAASKGLCEAYRSEVTELLQAQGDDVDRRKVALDKFRKLAKTPISAATDRKAIVESYKAVKAVDAEDEMIVTRASALTKVLSTTCRTPFSITVTTDVSADGSRGFFLAIPNSAVSTDQVTISTDSKGLLTSVNTTLEDQTGKIAISAATLIGEIVSLAAPESLVLKTFRAVNGILDQPQSEVDKLEPPQFEAAVQLGLKELSGVIYEAVPDPVQKPPAEPIKMLLADLGTLDPGDKSISGSVQVAGMTIKTTCSATASPPSVAHSQTKKMDGVMVSQERSCEVSAASTGKADSNRPEDHQRFWFTALDSRVPRLVPLDRTPLIARTTNLAFANGQLTTVTYNKPSQAAAAVALPGQLIGGFFSGIVSGVTGKQSTVKAQADYLNAEAAAYTAQSALIDARAKAKAAATPPAPAAPSGSPN